MYSCQAHLRVQLVAWAAVQRVCKVSDDDIKLVWPRLKLRPRVVVDEGEARVLERGRVAREVH
jgi:hypothetical protein